MASAVIGMRHPGVTTCTGAPARVTPTSPRVPLCTTAACAPTDQAAVTAVSAARFDSSRPCETVTRSNVRAAATHAPPPAGTATATAAPVRRMPTEGASTTGSDAGANTVTLPSAAAVT